MKTKGMIPILLLSILATIPASVAAQSAEERIQTSLNQAVDTGIPNSLLERKVEEGTAKGFPMDRIADAVQRRLEGLRRAQQALADVPDVAPGDLEVGADALESGVSGEALAELAESAPRNRRAAAIAALSYLVAADISPREALDRVQEALARGPEALQNLPAQVQGPDAVELPGGIPAPGGAPVAEGPGNVEVPSGLPDGPPGG